VGRKRSVLWRNGRLTTKERGKKKTRSFKKNQKGKGRRHGGGKGGGIGSFFAPKKATKSAKNASRQRRTGKTSDSQVARGFRLKQKEKFKRGKYSRGGRLTVLGKRGEGRLLASDRQTKTDSGGHHLRLVQIHRKAI